MAVSTRHIRHDWQRWLDTEQRYVKVLCGATTASKFAGIPGVTEQPLEIQKSTGLIVWGWCIPCVSVLHMDMMSLPEFIPSSKEVLRLYGKTFRITQDILRQAARPADDRSFLVKPLGGKHVNKYQWSGLQGNCYLCGIEGGGTIDHIIPLSRGGPNVLWNKAYVHARCNQKKAGLSLADCLIAFPNMEFPDYFLEQWDFD